MIKAQKFGKAPRSHSMELLRERVGSDQGYNEKKIAKSKANSLIVNGN